MNRAVGVHGMSITPFDADGEIDEALLRAHLRFMADGGVGVYLCSQGSGEGDLLSSDEKLAVYRIGVQEIGGRVPVCAAGIGLADATSHARDLAVAAQETGVDAVQVLGPRPGPLAVREDELERYFDAVIGAVTCDVHLSHNSVLMGYGLPAELVGRLVADHPNITAINLSEPVFGTLNLRLVELVDELGSRLEIRTGIVAELPTAHAIGARGALCFEANVAPDLVASVWAALERGDGAALRAEHGRLVRLGVALARGGNPRSLKAALALLGRDGGALREPYLPLTDPQVDRLAHDLASIGLLGGAGDRR